MPAPQTRLPWLSLLFAAGLLQGLASLPAPGAIRADEAAGALSSSQAAAEGILVMRSGEIIRGSILRSGGVYDVQTKNGRMAVPQTLVKLQAENLTAAYETLHDGAVAQQTANAHVLLAQWCLTNQLVDEARAELHAALRLEPDREDARRLLRNADEAAQKSAAPAAPEVAPDPLRAARQAAPPEDAVSLGGLSREQALQFARRIQPLLVNNCTAAGCHGRDSQNSFRMDKVTPGRGANRHAAERNLAEVLQWIDPKNPRSSRLLIAPRGKHGRRGRPIFVGPRGDEQVAELERWVVAVAAEEANRDRHDESDGRRKKSGARAAAGGDDRNPSLAGTSAARRDLPPVARPFEAGDSALSSRQPPLPPGQGDPFDPAVFNRGADRTPAR